MDAEDREGVETISAADVSNRDEIAVQCRHSIPIETLCGKCLAMARPQAVALNEKSRKLWADDGRGTRSFARLMALR